MNTSGNIVENSKYPSASLFSSDGWFLTFLPFSNPKTDDIIRTFVVSYKKEHHCREKSCGFIKNICMIISNINKLLIKLISPIYLKKYINISEKY
jgi:hypothetical protein